VVRRGRGVPKAPELDQPTLESVVQLSRALASMTRLRILIRLWRSPATVTALAGDIGMAQSAVSHQLQLLRGLDLVRATRVGQSVTYSLRDGHVALMLDEAISHTEHVRFGDAVGDDVRSGPRPTPGLGES
jgi:DNA-binding transcriptional ArsR family regulator